MSVKTQKLSELVEPVVASFDLQLWGIQFATHGSHSLLRVFIDSESGVDVEDCAQVSRQLSAVLDVEDPISGKYTLEVSSPGLDRPLFTLNQYQQYVGKQAKIKLNRSIEGRKKFKANLKGIDLDKQTVEFECDGEDYKVDFINIEKANIIGDVALNKTKSQKNA